MKINQDFMKITTTQIDQLYTFTRQHYVEWYDLQSELVDHLANAIESQLNENPKLTFDEVLNQEFEKFGIFGFMDVVDERRKFLDKKYRKLLWSYYKEFFKLPKIILSLGLIATVYKLSIAFDGAKGIIFGVIISMSFLFLISTLYKEKFVFDKTKSNRKKWLFEDVSIQNRNMVFFVLPSMVINSFNLIFKAEHFTNLTAIIFSVTLVLLGLLIYIKIEIIPKKVSQELAKTYPEYNLEIA